MRRVVLVAAQVQGPAGDADQVRPLLGVDLVQGPGAVHVVGVPVVVAVGQARPGPLGERAVVVDRVVGQLGQQGGPACHTLPAALFDVEGVGGVDGGPQGVPAGHDVAGGVDREHLSGAGGRVLHRVGRYEHLLPGGVGVGEEVLVEQREFHQRRAELVPQEGGVAGDLVVLEQRVQQPVGAAGPALAGEVPVVEVEHVAVLAVGAGRGEEPAGPVELGGVVAPVGELSEDEVEVALHGGAVVQDVSAGDLEVDVGVGGDVVGPGPGPAAGPDAGQSWREDPAGADEQVPSGVVHPLQQREVEDGPVAVLAGCELAGGQPAVGGGDVEVEAGAVEHRLVQRGVPAQQGGVVGGQGSERRLQRLGRPAGRRLVPVQLGEQQHLGGLGDDQGGAAGGDRGLGARDDDPGDALVAVRSQRRGVGAAQVEVAVATADRGGGGIGDVARHTVEGGVGAEHGVDRPAGRGQQFVDDDLVRPGDEGPALPGAVGVRPAVGDLAGAEVGHPRVVGGGAHARGAQLELVARVEGLGPAQRPVGGEGGRGAGVVARERHVLDRGETPGEIGRLDAAGAVGQDEAVVVEDDLLKGRCPVEHRAVLAVAGEEAVRPRGGGGRVVDTALRQGDLGRHGGRGPGRKEVAGHGDRAGGQRGPREEVSAAQGHVGQVHDIDSVCRVGGSGARGRRGGGRGCERGVPTAWAHIGARPLKRYMFALPSPVSGACRASQCQCPSRSVRNCCLRQSAPGRRGRDCTDRGDHTSAHSAAARMVREFRISGPPR